MRKLRLSLDALRVESFPTDDAGPREQGTVRAHQLLTRDLRLCWTAAGDTCDPAVYTCPECASPPMTYELDCGPTTVSGPDPEANRQ